MPERSAEPIDPGVDIGHVHLKVADVDRALDFYCGVLGFELMQRHGGYPFRWMAVLAAKRAHQ
jgi:catechol 2,3-dioxygenase-like lactoylglutathione lyase family enzyme